MLAAQQTRSEGRDADRGKRAQQERKGIRGYGAQWEEELLPEWDGRSQTTGRMELYKWYTHEHEQGAQA